jgi:hypothetical protein
MDNTPQLKFNLPKHGRANVFWNAQIALFKKNPRFVDYFRAIITFVKCSDTEPTYQSKIPGLDGELIFQFFSFILKLLPSRQKETYDVVINTFYYTIKRESEQQLICALVRAFQALDQRVLVFCNTEIALSLKKHLAPDLHEDTHFVDLGKIDNHFLRKFIFVLTRLTTRFEFNAMSNSLKKDGITLDFAAIHRINQKVFQRFIWSLWSEKLDFKFAVLRSEKEDYCYSIQTTSKKRKITTLGFQHGVISHTLDVPLQVDYFFTFGEQSSKIIAELNSDFYATVGREKPLVKIFPIGSLVDPINSQSNFEKKTVLFIFQTIDINSIWTQFYEIERHVDDLFKLVEKASGFSAIHKIIIRAHPDFPPPSEWLSMLKEKEIEIQVSDAQTTMEQDISQSSVSVGLFSGALCSSAASGLPTYFLEVNDGYFTPDLDCFRGGFVLSIELLIEKLYRLITDSVFYMKERENCLAKSSLYYANGQQAKINQEFVQKYILST